MSRIKYIRYKSSFRSQLVGGVDLGKIAYVFIGFAILSLLTASYYSGSDGKSFSGTLTPKKTTTRGGESKPLGSLNISRANTVYQLDITSKVSMNHWYYVEGQVLDADQNWLMSFGKEMWDEQGRDSDGYWREQNTNTTIHITFPKAGKYYLQFETESIRDPYPINLKITPKKGSSLPFNVFGIILLLGGAGLWIYKHRYSLLARMVEAD